MPRSRRFLLRYACGVRPLTPRPHASNVFDACGIQSASGVYLPPQQQLAQLERRLRAVGEREHRSQIAVRVIRDYLDGTKRVSLQELQTRIRAVACHGSRGRALEARWVSPSPWRILHDTDQLRFSWWFAARVFRIESALCRI